MAQVSHTEHGHWTVTADYRNVTINVCSPQPFDTDGDVLQGHVVTRQEGMALNL